MKEKLKSFFVGDRSSGNRKMKIFLTVVALVEILAIMVVSTSAWIESVTSIKIYTTYDASTKPGGTKGVIESALKQRVNVSDTGSAIDLAEYFRQSGGYHMTAASSADGDTFYFPEANVTGADQHHFRYGDISDKNVNYISFTVKVTSANDFAFESAPNIMIGNTTISNDLVRFSIGYRSSATAAANFAVYGLVADSTEVVSAVDGSTGPTSVRAFSDYLAGGGNRVVSTVDGSLLTVNIWIQDPTFENTSVYENKELTISNFKLVPVHKFELKIATNNVEGGSGGTVAINNGDFGTSAVGYFAYGKPIQCKAIPNLSDAFQFSGWATSASGNATYSAGTPTNNIYTLNYSFANSSSAATLYAKFTDVHDLFFKPQYKHADISNTGTNGTYAMYLWQWNPATQTIVKEWHVMSYVSSGTWNGYYKGTYKGTATNVIFCYMNPYYRYNDRASSATSGGTTIGSSTNQIVYLNQVSDGFAYKYLQTFDLVFPPELGEYGYIATSRYTTKAAGQTIDSESDTSAFPDSYVMGYWKDNYTRVTASVDNNYTGGSVSVGLTNSTTHPSGSTWKSTPYNSGSYYVNLDGRKYDGNVNGSIVTDRYSKKVTLTATPSNAGYRFVGWYLNGVQKSTSETYTVEGPNNPDRNTGTEYTNVEYKARFAVVPSPWYLKGSFNNWDETTQMTRSSTDANIYTATAKITSEGGTIEFKIYNSEGSGSWYGYGNNYSTTYSFNNTLTTSGDNIKLQGHKGEYTFTFNSKSKYLTVSATSYDDITITFNYTSSNTWVASSSAQIKFACSEGVYDPMSGPSNYEFTASVPSNYATSCWFNRHEYNNAQNNWNNWNAGNRGFSTEYKVTGDGTGGWQ